MEGGGVHVLDARYQFSAPGGNPGSKVPHGETVPSGRRIWKSGPGQNASGIQESLQCGIVPGPCPRRDVFNGFSDELRWEKDGDDLVARAEMTIQLHNHNLGLAALAKAAEEKKMKPGRDFNIISYNESPINDIILNGLTTISTDFAEMGRRKTF